MAKREEKRRGTLCGLSTVPVLGSGPRPALPEHVIQSRPPPRCLQEAPETAENIRAPGL